MRPRWTGALKRSRGREEAIEEGKREVEGALSTVRKRLEELSGLSALEAKEELVAGLRNEAEAEAAQQIRQVRDEAQRTANREAKKIISPRHPADGRGRERLSSRPYRSFNSPRTT